MGKKNIGARTFLPTMPIALVGTSSKGKPNYMAAGFVGGLNIKPPIVAIGINQKHQTRIGIDENQAFSVNFPTADMVEIVDYCGLVSGRTTDKTELFKTFYGDLESIPMIEECPINLECKLKQQIDFGFDVAFFGEIINVYVNEDVLTENKVDMVKVNPLVYAGDGQYYKLGEKLGSGWSIGKNFKPKNKS